MGQFSVKYGNEFDIHLQNMQRQITQTHSLGKSMNTKNMNAWIKHYLTSSFPRNVDFIYRMVIIGYNVEYIFMFAYNWLVNPQFKRIIYLYLYYYQQLLKNGKPTRFKVAFSCFTAWLIHLVIHLFNDMCCLNINITDMVDCGSWFYIRNLYLFNN